MTATSVPLYIAVQAFLGQPDYTHETILNFISGTTLTGTKVYKTTVALADSTTDQQVNLATLFPNLTACKLLIVIEITSTPVAISIGFAAGASKALKAGYPFIFPLNGTAPGSLYLSNSSGGAAEVMVIAVA